MVCCVAIFISSPCCVLRRCLRSGGFLVCYFALRFGSQKNCRSNNDVNVGFVAPHFYHPQKTFTHQGPMDHRC